jgi:putative nucleotidyltransferase with HDIG domain
MVGAHTVRPEAIAASFEAIVQKKLANDKLVVPPMPVAAVKCLQILKEPDYNTKRLVAVLEQDPPLAARVLRLATSAAMAGGGNIKTIEQAVNRVGAQRVRALLLEASAMKVFESRDPRIAGAFKATWEHSLAVAMLSRDLAAFAAKDADADAAYLCGLLHDVGKPVLGTLLLEAEKQLVRGPGQAWLDGDDWMAAVNKGHRRIGVALAEKWKLP